MATRKPRVNTSCVADRYAGPREKIIEISSDAGGCLIALLATEDGHLLVSVYQADKTVTVSQPCPSYRE